MKEEGNFEKNKAQGFGKYFFADGRYYEGEFNNGKIVNEENIVMNAPPEANIKNDNNFIDNDLEFNTNLDFNNNIIKPKEDDINDILKINENINIYDNNNNFNINPKDTTLRSNNINISQTKPLIDDNTKKEDEINLIDNDNNSKNDSKNLIDEKIITPRNGTYEGDTVNGLKEGKGVLIDDDGNKYDGE